ncbi:MULTISPECIES: amidohydrolase family protein [unclassified Pseudoalteromonas]|uniref:amidohydrolase family protein n=1 Tax=unclassified Pseudoalteromonas TaxID=194690 RepID=UPI001F15DD99|nr:MULTISPECIES: amidohydrolase family protein [unclassified Pseudoalteromonas]MDP2635132.1 amidohydrolase family protein [Pseudoalteromonas sp. 1_MG-2023]
MFKVLLLSISLFSFASLAKDNILIENVTIVSSHLQAPKTQMNVLLSDGRISEITRKKISSFDLKINGLGKFLTPGLMDSHAHVSSIPGMGFGVEPVAIKNQVLAQAYFEQQPRSFLYYGVTQILDPNPGVSFDYFTSAPQHPDYFRCEVLTSKNTFPYVEKTDDLSRSMFTYLIDESAGATTENSVERLIGKIADSGASCIKLYFEDGYGNANQWATLSTNTLKRIKQAAKKSNLLIVAHANALDMQQLALLAGVDVIAHGMWNWGQYNREQNIPKEISNTLNKMINDEVAYMPTQRVIAGLGEVMDPTIVNSPEFSSVTPKPLIDWYKTAEAQWFKEELRVGFDGMPDQSISDAFLYGRIGKGNKVIQYLKSADHPILLASDFPGSPSFANQPGLTTYQEMKAMVTAGLSLEEVLAAATINNAKQFKIENDYGTVEVGKIANLLLLKSNPLDSIESWNSIETIILHGEPIKRESLAAKK